MTQPGDLKLIASLFCTQYKTEAKAYVDEAHPSGQRHLVVQYANGRPEFLAAIPDDWDEKDVVDLLLWPMESPEAPYPAWEVPARVYGSATLFRWWAGERPS